MTEKKTLPVIFLAFANDQESRANYLRKLAEEARHIRETLETTVVRSDLCELVIRQNATVDEILDVFQDPSYRNRITVFHFGGHANGYQLLLEDAQGKQAVADAGGLSEFLGLQENLQLVFLNGCSTEPQVQGLLDANVPVVIATIGPIKDDIAADFAARFYQALACGRNLGAAYDEAVAALHTKAGGTPRHLYLVSSQEIAASTERWPWIRQVRPGAEMTLSWNLPEAANAPLFTLPSIPEELWQGLPESPFRGLDWFAREHAPIFFGRGYEIRELYQQITAPHAPPLILFYGQSGVGKSSLLAAGLLPRLEQSQTVRYQRRDQTNGLLGTLRAALAERDTRTSLVAAWHAIERHDHRPLLVVLDQAEEAFTHPAADHPNEVTDLLSALSAIFADPNHRPQGKLILSFRKEWLAEIKRQVMEQKLPHAEVFLRRLSDRGVVEAIEGPTRVSELQAKYRLTIEKTLPPLVADDLLADRESAVAPTLQILLTKLWERAKGIQYDQPCFTYALYDELRKQGLGLGDVLDQQLAELKEHQPDVVQSGLALDVLAYHTTALGAAAEHTLEELRQTYQHCQEALEPLRRKCEELYLLVDPARNIPDKPASSRLAHDTLAPLVRQRFDESDALGQRARRILENRAVEWTQGQTGTPLDDADLNAVESGRTGMRTWTKAEERLLTASRVERMRRQRRQRFWLRTGILAALLIVGFAVMAGWQWTVAERRLEETYSATWAAYAQEEHSYGDTDLAIDLAYTANVSVTSPSEFAQHTLLRFAYLAPGTRRLFTGHDNVVTSVAFSPNGKTVLSGSVDKNVILWNLDGADNPIIHRFEGHGAEVTSVAYDPTDPNRFISGSKDGRVIVWNIDTGATKSLYHSGGVNSVAFHPDGNMVLAGVDDGSVVLWDVTTGEGKKLCDISAIEINSVTFSPDGAKAIAGTHHGGPDPDTIYVWDVATREQIHKIPQAGNYGVRSLAVSPDSRFILAGAGGYGPPIYLLNMETGTITRTFQGHSGGDVHVAFDPQNPLYAATGSYDNQIILWDIMNGKEIQRFLGHNGRITSLAFSPDGRQILSGSTDRTLRLWDIYGGAESARYQGASAAVSSVACSNDGETVAASYMNDVGSVYMWSAWEQNSRTFSLGRRASDLDVSSDGRTALAGLAQGDNNLVLWDLNENIERGRFAQDGWITGVAFSPIDMNTALVSSYGNSNQPGFPRGSTLVLWNVATGKKIRDLSYHKHIVQDVIFSPDGQRALSGSADKTAIVWDLTTGMPIHTLTGHYEAVTSVAFVPPDGRRAITGSADRSVILWDTQEGKLLYRLTGHKSRIITVDVNSDGTRAVSGSEDGTTIVWDLETNTKLIRMIGHSGAVNKLIFCGNNHSVLSAGNDTTVRLWDIELPRDIVAWTTANRYIRELTSEEQNMVDIDSRLK